MSALKEALKNEYTKQILRSTGIRKQGLQQRKTPHYRMPLLEEAGQGDGAGSEPVALAERG